MTREMSFDAFRQQAFAPTLAPAGEGGASAFRLHAGAKAVLLFTCAFGSLESAFHKTAESPGAIRERLQ